MKIKRIRRSPEEAREQILAALGAALDDQAFHTLTVEAITERAGMTRSAFYHYFSNLDELALGLLAHFEDDIRASVDPWLGGASEHDADYRRATLVHLTDMFEVFYRHRKSVGAVAQAAGGSHAVFEQWQSRVIDYFVDETASFISGQVAAGRSRVADPARTARALILMNNGVMMDGLTRKAPDDPAVTARTIADIWNAVIYDRTPIGEAPPPARPDSDFPDRE